MYGQSKCFIDLMTIVPEFICIYEVACVKRPIGAPDISHFRLVDMFTACTIKTVKDTILETFRDAHGNLQVVIATVAFGMGLDCPNVCRVIHWGASNDVEEYIQGFWVDEAIFTAEDAYLCVPCFRRMEGTVQLRQQLAQKERNSDEPREEWSN